MAPFKEHLARRLRWGESDGSPSQWESQWVSQWTPYLRAPKKEPQSQKIAQTAPKNFLSNSRALPNKTRVLRQLAPESSPESSAKSLSQKLFGVPFLSLHIRSGQSDTSFSWFSGYTQLTLVFCQETKFFGHFPEAPVTKLVSQHQLCIKTLPSPNSLYESHSWRPFCGFLHGCFRNKRRIFMAFSSFLCGFWVYMHIRLSKAQRTLPY